MRPGALCVMDSGQDLMHKWPADSWDILQVVCMKTFKTVCSIYLLPFLSYQLCHTNTLYFRHSAHYDIKCCFLFTPKVN